MLRFLFGVFLPLVAWTVEINSHICAEVFFDPLPGPLFSLLWLTIPVSNAWILWAKPEHRRGLGVLCGMAQVVAVVYTIWFLPLTLLSFLAIVFWGLGLCSLSPLLALPFCLTGLRSVSEPSRPAGRWFGVLLALLLMTLSFLPVVLTYTGLQLARNPATRSRGLGWLRAWGDQQTLLEACYNQAGWVKCPVGMLICMGSPPPPQEVREIFFRAQGVPFNDFPPPRSASRFLDDGDFDGMVSDDLEQGQAKVGGRNRGLGLQQSSLAARVDSTGSTARWDWDLTFANQSASAREARCQVLLPPGAVASGAVLWVKEKPRQALIASRGKARVAYEAVVSQQRDPLLVTTAGPQRLLVQCFPVPPSGTMHIRLSITAPLLLDGDSASLKVPCILERNFEMQTAHSLKVECPLPHTRLPDSVPGTGLSSPLLREVVKRPPQASVWCLDRRSQAFTEARWTIPKPAAGPLWVVVDGSVGMQPYRREIAAALREFRSPQPVGVLLAGDEVQILQPLAAADAATMEQAAHQMEIAPLEGGQDDVPALLAAKEGQILWLHAGQSTPVDVGPLAPRANSIVSLACRSGPNFVLEELGCQEAVRTGSIGVDMQRQLAVLSGQRPDWQRLQLTQLASQPPGQESNFDDLSLLWANAQPANLKLAVRYGLVTPLTGAVVLENEAQERQLGLRPKDDIPVVPEPATLALLGVLGSLLLGGRALRRWR